MSDKPTKCQAVTKAGNPCKNNALPGQAYCGIHQAATTNGQTTSPSPQGSVETAELQELVAELRTLVQDLETRMKRPRLRDAIKGKLAKLAPDSLVDLAEDLKNSLQGTTPQDLIDLDTWRGFWYVFTYMLASESEPYRKQMASYLLIFPGGSVVAEKVYAPDDDDDWDEVSEAEETETA